MLLAKAALKADSTNQKSFNDTIDFMKLFNKLTKPEGGKAKKPNHNQKKALSNI